jgi:hypothetical protein
VATNAEQRRTTTTVVIARAATLGLGRPNYLDRRPNQIGIQGEPSSLHHIQNGVKLASLFAPRHIVRLGLETTPLGTARNLPPHFPRFYYLAHNSPGRLKSWIAALKRKALRTQLIAHGAGAVALDIAIHNVGARSALKQHCGVVLGRLQVLVSCGWWII